MFEEDLDSFLDTDEFAVEVRSVNPERAFAAIFDDVGSVSEIGGVVLENANATLTCKPSDVEGFIWERTQVEVEGAGIFTVTRTKPDGGFVKVELE